VVTQPDIPAEGAGGGPPGPPASPPRIPASAAGPPATQPFTRPAPPEHDAEAASAPPSQPRPTLTGSPRFWLTVVAAVLGIAGLAASVVGLAAQILPRKFSAAQQQQIMSWETASRWRDWPAGRIFPDTVGYQLPGTDFGAASGLTLRAHRVGIAPQSTCTAATDKPLARVLTADGCQDVLRATYTDGTDSYVVTVGVAVLHGTAPAPSSLPQDKGLRPGVKTVPFSHTLAAGFGNRDRQLSGAYRRGPYLVLYTVGYADSRHYDHVSMDSYADSEMTGVGDGVAGAVGSALGAAPPVPKCPGAPGC
jgi:hypothetical protein